MEPKEEEEEASDLADLQWAEPEKLVTIYEDIYSILFRSETAARRATGPSSTSGVLGVITVGVIAGLILDWISPRKLE